MLSGERPASSLVCSVSGYHPRGPRGCLIFFAKSRVIVDRFVEYDVFDFDILSFVDVSVFGDNFESLFVVGAFHFPGFRGDGCELEEGAPEPSPHM